MQPTKTRMAEICELPRGWVTCVLGLAFCLGLAREAAVVEEILKRKGFEVISVLCKAGRTQKEELGLKEEHKIFQGKPESMCNPIYQAKLLNHEKTDFNILLGLCVGRFPVLQVFPGPHNRAGGKGPGDRPQSSCAIYLSGTYYQKLKNP